MNDTPAFLRMPTSLANGQPRHDIYLGIHKGIRAFMCHALTRLGRVDLDDAAELADTLAGVEVLLDFCRAHLEHEDGIIHPALEARLPRSTEQVAEEHREHEDSLVILRAQLRQVRDSHGPARAQAALRLYRLLAVFVGQNFLHMHLEETESNNALWRAYTDEEILALKQRILALQSPADISLCLRWMVPALNPAERLALLRPMRANMPTGAFEHLLLQLRPHLTPAEWAKLEGGLRLAA